MTEFGINLGDINQLITENCNIHHCGYGAVGGPVGVSGGWRNAVIKNTALSWSGYWYDGTVNGTGYDRPDGFGIEQSNGPIEVYDCLIEKNRGDGFDCKAHNTYIHNCIIANNRCDAIKLWGNNTKAHDLLVYGCGNGAPSGPWASLVIDCEVAGANIEVINCTFNDNTARNNYISYIQYDSTNSINLTLKNNIFANGSNVLWIRPTVNLTAMNNDFFCAPLQDNQVEKGLVYTKATISSLGNGNICSDPKFVYIPPWGSTGNFHLQSNSPCIDKGVNVTGIPGYDIEYTTRPQGTGIDIGTYEYYVGESSGVVVVPSAPTNFVGVAISTTQINWSWTDNATNELGYRIKNSTDGIVANLSANTTFYVELGLVPNVSYSRYVEVYNAGGSRTSSATTVYTLANPPTNLQISSRTDSTISLIWSSGEGGNTRYAIDRSTVGTNSGYVWRQQWLSNLTTTAYTDTSLLPGTTYWYRVYGYNGDGIITDYTCPVSTVTIFINIPLVTPETPFKKTLDNVKTLPNIWRGKGNIRFTNLTKNTRIKIYNIAGELVREIYEPDKNEVEWDIAKDNLSSGIYICMFKNENGEIKKIKVVVLR